MDQIFLSYASEDKARVDEIYVALRRAGLNPWMDNPPHPYRMDGLQPGEYWEPGIDKRMREARIILSFFSRRSVEKEGYVQKEYRRALDWSARKPQHRPSLIPVLLDECTLPDFRVDTVSFHQIQWYRLYESTVEDLTDYLLKLTAGSEKTEAAESQYVGHLLFLAGSENVAPPANAAAVETHQAFFQDYSSEEPVTPLGTPPRAGEKWQVVAEWDAGHQVPKRGDGQKINPPSLVAWAPKEDRLFTACDAFGMTVWSISGLKYEEVSNDAAYGYPRRFFTFQRGYSGWILQETESYRNRYYSVYDFDAHLICEGANVDLWGFIKNEGMSNPYWKLGLNPWRPRSNGEVAFVHEFSKLKFVDVTRLPEKPKSGRMPLHEAPATHSLSFESFGQGGSTIFSFHFHPSGEYVAVTTGDWEDTAQRRVYIVHIATAQVVARIPASTRELGWSPGGRFLLFKKWRQDAEGKRTARLGMFDSHNFRVRYELSEDLHSLPWVRLALARERGTALSADGQRVLTESATAVAAVVSGDCSAHAGEKVSQIAEHNFADAAWHPSDPHCFVTVGGEGSESYPDTYRRDHDIPHGRLLRIWRLAS